ncbi:MAG: dipeptide/oligopeptide/nickel ABC transporter permease/ATP-binding protein [Clostridia bacterium]|nr:dipeptide/oligopeptide/nickel ABC transporter permease/ATP-binding protein [Clostridia bacterium]
MSGEARPHRRFFRQPVAVAALAVLLARPATVAAAPLLAPADPAAVDLAAALAPPGPGHPLGTDENGRDVLSRLLYGGRVSLGVGLVAAAVACFLGTALGLVSGYAGGWVDAVIMRAADVFLAVPLLFVLLAAGALWHPDIWGTMALIGAFSWMGVARLVRSEVLVLREAAFVEAARVGGASPLRIVVWHLLPHVLPLLLVAGTLMVGGAITAESVLSFLGLGVQPPQASWGSMLSNAQSYLWVRPALAVYPGAAIFVTVLAYHYLAEGLRAAVDPRYTFPVLGAPHRCGGVPPRTLETVSGGTDASDTPGTPDIRDTPDTVLALQGLTVQVMTAGGPATAVDGVELLLRRGEAVALVGESGSGKTLTALAALGLLPQGAVATAGRAWVRTATGVVDMLSGPARLLEDVRGRTIAAVFQEPFSTLNPVLTVGEQVAEVIRRHEGVGRGEARARAVQLLGDVGLPDPARRARAYPHQLSGGMRQRVAIAVALAGRPQVLVADEPTSALDATVQAQVLALLARERAVRGLALLLVTHDLAVAAALCSRLVVLYAGQVVESGPLRDILVRPRHPYTHVLLAAATALPTGSEPLPAGRVALPTGRVALPTGHTIAQAGGLAPGAWPVGCRFHPRCPFAVPDCQEVHPPLVSVGPGRARCWRAHELVLAGVTDDRGNAGAGGTPS